MFAAGDSKDFREEPSHEHVENHFAGITDFFLPAVDALEIPYGDCAILAPTWFQLRPLGRQLREYGIPVVGPGARPYKRSHLFARLAEEVCAYTENPLPSAIHAIEKELFHLVTQLTGKANFQIFSYNGRRITFRLLHAARDLRELHEGAVPWLEAAAQSFAEILCDEGLAPVTFESLMAESVAAMCRDMENAEVDLVNLSLSNLGMFANPDGNLKLLTIHQSKGREFSAVALVALHDGIIPFHNRHVTLTAEGEVEARRVLYVAITRAKRLLMCFTNEEDWRPPCRFFEVLALPGVPPRN